MRMSVHTLATLASFRDKLMEQGEEKIGKLLTEAMVETHDLMIEIDANIADDRRKNWWRIWK